MNQPLSAHEVIAMNEALMTKAANIELMSSLSQQVQDARLRQLLQKQVQAIRNHYNIGVSLLQGHGQMTNLSGQYHADQFGSPQLGLRNPTMPAPQMSAQSLSDRTIATTVLNLHKHGCISSMMFALECTNTQLRRYLADGANVCDTMAYETWTYMNSQGYYQVPTLKDQTTQTMIQAFQPGNTGFEAQPYQ